MHKTDTSQTFFRLIFGEENLAANTANGAGKLPARSLATMPTADKDRCI